jgi:hypothetical protein
MNEPPLVRIAANCVRRMIYQYRDEFVAGMIVAGWDKKLGGQVILNIIKKSFISILFRSILVHLAVYLSDNQFHSVVRVVLISGVISIIIIDQI